MFNGQRDDAILVSKVFGNPVENRVTRLLIDTTGRDIQEVWINGSRQDDELLHKAIGKHDGRRIVRLSVPRISNPYVSVKIRLGGNAIIHGIFFESER